MIDISTKIFETISFKSDKIRNGIFLLIRKFSLEV